MSVKQFQIWVLAFLFSVGTFISKATDPFGVEASLEKTDEGAALLVISFILPSNHYIYEDSIAVAAGDNASAAPLFRPDPQEKYDESLEKNVAVYTSSFELKYPLEEFGDKPFNVTVSYMGCDGTVCFLPQEKYFAIKHSGIKVLAEAPKTATQTEGSGWQQLLENFRLTGQAEGFMNASDFLAFLNSAEREEAVKDGGFADKSILMSLFLILAAGIMLNLTPCVLPMIPVNLAIIGAGASSGSRHRGFLLGGAYGAGIAIAYGVLGILAVLAGARFGSLNSSPVFNIVIALVFLVLALAMFGVINLDFSRFASNANIGSSGAGSIGAAFLLGSISALLAGACVAPVIISVLLFAAGLYSSGVWMGLLLPFVLGVGMALPWPFAGAGLSLLPKTGRWMERVKQVFGVIILGAALYYGYIGYTMLMLSKNLPEQDEEGWMTSLDQALVIAKDEQKMVFIDFWANWCKSCREMDRITFKDESVKASLDKYVKVKFRADNQKDPYVKAVLDRFVKVGLPAFAVLKPELENVR